VGAEAYYLSQVARGIDDYYSGAGESEGRWLGTGSQILNLPDAVTGDDLRAILAGLAPGTGLSPNGTQIRPFKGRVPGFDLTFSAPKSVSVLYAFADPLVRAEVSAAVDAAVGDALAWLEREACFVRRGSNNRRSKTAPFEQWGTRRLHGAGFIAAGFRHRTSRAGDPQLHSHVLIANLTRGPDGRWSALDGQALYRSKLAAGVVFQTALRNELTQRLGIRWRPVHDHVADIAGIPQRVLTHFSKRRNEIEDELDRMGLSGPAAAAQVTLATRTAKVEIDQDTLDERWAEDGATIGFGDADVDRLLVAVDPINTPPDLSPARLVPFRHVDPITGEARESLLPLDDFAAALAWEVTERSGAFTRLDVQNAVADHLRGTGGTAFLERLTDHVLSHKEMVPLPRPDAAAVEPGWEQRWTTRRMLQIEAELRGMFEPSPIASFALDPARIDEALSQLGGTLGHDQFDTVRRLTTQGLAVEAVVGRAGTGKTYTMDAVRHVFASHGRRVIGVSPTARAARELADGANIETFTVPRLFSETTVGAGDVVIVDEAGMCGTLDLHRVVSHARFAGAKVVLVGDHHQLPEVAAGGGFRAALEVIGDRRCELTVNRRQIEVWEHTALDHLRHGNVAAFWDAYRSHDRISLTDTRGELHARALSAWWDHYRSGSDAHLIAGTRSEARLLNQLARHYVAASGILTGPPLTVRDREFQIGDRVVLLRNSPGQTNLATGTRCRVDNGTIATITKMHATGEIEIHSPAGPVRLTSDYVQSGAVDHGYATTIHKAQGVTCDHIHVVGPAGLYREAAYVALSRARRSAHIYATTRDAATIGEPAHTTGIPLLSENVDNPEADLTRALTTSRAKQFVTGEHPDLDRSAELATGHDLAALNDRLRFIRDVVADLRQEGVCDPADTIHELRLAEEHRRRMHVGGRVNARDWDNVGTIEQIDDGAGESVVRFVSDTGHTTTRRLPWHLLKPVDQPNDTVLTDAAVAHLDAAAQRVGEHACVWQEALAEHGIDVNEPGVIRHAIAQREDKVMRALRAMPPTWLTWWAGTRPTNPIAAVVYDDHLASLARWRDLQRLDPTVPGFGPPPDDSAQLDEWRTLTDQALATRQFLLDATPPVEAVPPLGAADARARLDELDTLLATAPPDQRLAVDQLLSASGDGLTDIVEALRTAMDQQQVRRDWILEHWPHIVERHELTTLLGGLDPLAHWPIAISPDVIELLDEIDRRTASEDPELTPLPELDRLAEVDERETEIDRINSERASIGRQLQDLGTVMPPDHSSAELVRQQRRRLSERARELDAELRRVRGRITLSKWRPTRSTEAEARIKRRLTQIVNEAASERAEWIVELAQQALADPNSPSIEGVVSAAREVGGQIEGLRATPATIERSVAG
jgi:conjugative relaxase-like TrwC/TraI family protein